jgi:TolB-like protein/Tfp pilus assembly protein PilF/tRNA A-37 threonylcarbamoyl transferase component Bud32
VTDEIAALRSSLRGSYEIEREIGQGAFATVYLATDLKHDRLVAIKVLKAYLAHESGERRFIQEIRLLARLQHPNILPLYDSGRVESLLYYVMPYVKGETLRDRLEREHQLPIDAACNIAREAADALAFAHSEKIIHRDIKPENILLSNGHAVVADFGVARAIDLANLQHLTRTSAGVPGTPLYMSPEQLLGDTTPDNRSDIYSLGCVLFEMLAGRPPFTGKDGIFRRFSGPVPLASECRKDVAVWLDETVSRALARDANDRFQDAHEFAAALSGFSASGSDPRGRVAGTQRWSVSRAYRALRRPRVAAFSIAALAALTALAWAGTRPGSRPATSTVAVLPFANVGGDSTQQYLADGMADGLATALGKVPGISVVSRTVTSHYRGRADIDAREIRKLLGADYVVYATLRRLGERLRVSVQLINATDNAEAWSESYDRNAADAYAVQDSITHAVAVALSPRRSSSQTKAAVVSTTASSGTSNPDAYDLYLRGRYLLMRRGPGVAQAVTRFEQAIEKDGKFARAHAGLALALELLPYFSSVSASSVSDRAVAAANRALALDSTQAEAHTALALALQHAYKWDAALREHQRAIALDPNDAAARTQYGRQLHYMGRVMEAKAQFQLARAADPYDAVASGWFGHLLSLTNQNDSALAEVDRALEIDSDSAPPVLFMAAQANIVGGDTAAGRRLAKRLWERVPAWRGSASGLLARLGDREIALAIARKIEANPEEWSVGVATGAVIYLTLGDTARALDLLERATDAGAIWPTSYSLSEREFDPLRGSARFAAIVRGVGLDERIFTSPNGGRPAR